jgi:MFS family permease
LTRLSLLSRDLKLFYLAAALFGFALFNGIYPVLFNLYLLRLGYGSAFIGLVSAVGMVAFSLFAFPAGMFANRWGARNAMALGVGIAGLCYGLQALAEFVPDTGRGSWLLANRVLSSVGIALYYVNSVPFLIGASGPRDRHHLYSFRGAVDTLAGFGGSLAGGALPGLFALLLGVSLSSPAPYRASLAIAALLCVPAALALRAMSDAYRTVESKTTRDRPLDGAPVRLIAVMALVVLLRSAAVGTSRTFFNVYLDDGLGVPTARIGLAFALIQVASVPVVLAVPVLVQRWGQFRVICYGSSGAAASMLPLALIPDWVAAVLGRTGVYAFSSVTDPASSVFQMEVVPPRWRAAMAGVTNTVLGLSWATFALLGGFWVAALGYRALFLGAAVLTSIGTGLFWLYFRKPRGPGSSADHRDR